MPFEGTLPEQEDQSKVKAVLEKNPLPPEIGQVEIQFKNDHDGTPAMYLSFELRVGALLGKEQIPRLSRYMSDVLDQLLRSGLSRFPYASLDEAA
jgi:hypothetical protein